MPVNGPVMIEGPVTIDGPVMLEGPVMIEVMGSTSGAAVFVIPRYGRIGGCDGAITLNKPDRCIGVHAGFTEPASGFSKRSASAWSP